MCAGTMRTELGNLIYVCSVSVGLYTMHGASIRTVVQLFATDCFIKLSFRYFLCSWGRCKKMLTHYERLRPQKVPKPLFYFKVWRPAHRRNHSDTRDLSTGNQSRDSLATFNPMLDTK